MAIQQTDVAILFDEGGLVVSNTQSVTDATAQAEVLATMYPGWKYLVVPATSFVFVEETP